MQKIEISTPSSHSEILCGQGAFGQFAAESAQNCYIVTDSNVFSLYRPLIEEKLGGFPVFVLKAGEKSKNSKQLLSILKDMIDKGLTRKSTVIALGGGVVGDIAGLAASLYMRGVNAVQIPTTLLSQVDSSVGGKTAVDMGGVKNVIGAFYQPSRVIVDPMFLKTLPSREIRCGVGEIVKYGALDGEIFDMLLSHERALADFTLLEQLIPMCIEHKAKVVTEDEHDLSGARKSLNLGHTTGHAFELLYKRRSHGEFVLIGMYYELFIAQNMGVCDKEYADIFRRLIRRVIGKVPAFYDVSAAKFDKKNANRESISLVVPKCRGKWQELTLGFDEYSRKIAECADGLRGSK